MSGQVVELRWSVIVDDLERWTPENLAKLERSHAGSGPDMVQAELIDVMEEAARDYIERHPDLFRGDLV